MLRSRWCLLMVLCCLPSAGCVEGNVRDFLVYDKATDTFKGLEVYTNLRAKAKVDMDYLVSLYGHRESIIIDPVLPTIFTKDAVQRKEKHKFVVVGLGTPPANTPEIVTTTIDLDSITVQPGEFFLDENKNLGYYQAAVFPGMTVDAVLQEARPVLSRAVGEYAQDQVKMSEFSAVKHVGWEQLRKHFLARLDDKNAPPPQAGPGPLDNASLKLLRDVGRTQTIKVSRKEAIFQTVLPLSKDDCKELVSTVAALKGAVTKRVKEGKPVDKGLPEALRAVEVREVDGARVEISVDLLQLMKAKAIIEAMDLAPDKSKGPDFKKTIALIEDHGVKINKVLSIQDMIAKYKGN
jgi:hypothetical protein